MDGDETIFFIFPKDIASVQGSTEAYYIGKQFSTEFDTHLFTTSEGEFFGARVHDIPGAGFLALAILNLFYLPHFLYLGLKYRPTVVYFYRNVIVPPLVLKYTVGSTLVCDLQCDPYEQPKEFLQLYGGNLFQRVFIEMSFLAHKLVMRQSDLVVTLSEPLKNQLIERYDVAPRDVLVVPLGVDTEKFTPNASGSDRLRLVYLGSFGARRSIGTVAEAIANLSESEQSDLRFEIFGAGDEEYIERLRDRLSTTECEFIYHGFVPHEDIPKEVGACDVAVSPLPEHDAYEVSSPAKIFEYLALGLPVVATAIRAHEKLLTDGEDALLVEPGSSASIEDAISNLLADERLVESLSAAARENALQHNWTNRFETIRTEIDARMT